MCVCGGGGGGGEGRERKVTHQGCIQDFFLWTDQF